jgi:hypothetical protein
MGFCNGHAVLETYQNRRFLREIRPDAYGNVAFISDPWPFFILYWTKLDIRC